jgi:hypothetical protein
MKINLRDNNKMKQQEVSDWERLENKDKRKLKISNKLIQNKELLAERKHQLLRRKLQEGDKVGLVRMI